MISAGDIAVAVIHRQAQVGNLLRRSDRAQVQRSALLSHLPLTRSCMLSSGAGSETYW